MAAGIAVVVAHGDDVAALDDAVGGEDRKHAADVDAGDVVVVVLDGDLPAVCYVGVDAVGKAAVGCTVAVDAAVEDDMGGLLCSCLDAFPQALAPFCLDHDPVHDPAYFLQPLIPQAPYSKEALEEDVCVVYLAGEEGLHVLV